MRTEFEFAESVVADGSSVTAIEWLLRSYETSAEWKATATDVYFSVNGDSNVARNRVAGIVRSYFVETPLIPENVRRWGKSDIETVQVSPPNISDSNATYVDWVYIADFLLLHCSTVTEELEEENQRRETEFQNALRSYKLRLAVVDAREAVRRDAQASEKEILETLKILHPEASLATIKEARKLEKFNVVTPQPREPQPSPLLRYKPLYFLGINGR